METIKTRNGNKIQLINDIDQMTIGRYNQFQCQLITAAIGQSMDEVTAKFSRLDQFLSAKKIDLAASERRLIQQNIWSAINKINYQSFVFACLVHSIDGDERNDISEGGLQDTVKALEQTGLTQNDLKQANQKIKKKFKTI